MEVTSLIFDAECRMLGELSTKDGTLSRAVLSEEGDRVIGSALSLWQTEGVPFLRQMKDVQVQEHISVRDTWFLEAVRQWASVMHLQLFSVTSEVLECWQLMTRLPLDDFQRYSMLLALRSLSESELADWRASLVEATEEVKREHETCAENIRKMWEKIVQQLILPKKRRAD